MEWVWNPTRNNECFRRPVRYCYQKNAKRNTSFLETEISNIISKSECIYRTYMYKTIQKPLGSNNWGQGFQTEFSVKKRHWNLWRQRNTTKRNWRRWIYSQDIQSIKNDSLHRFLSLCKTTTLRPANGLNEITNSTILQETNLLNLRLPKKVIFLPN